MADSAADAKLEAQKRRSARISQAVPITVSGVDALGRPFQERTSTIVVNCHGCRYQSKHYVLKNMSVTIEVPHSEPNQPPRTVRARVTWIQRPRTVRELFQIGIELETPGNIWGIAFPEPDWFPFPETVEPEIPAAGLLPQEPNDNLRVLRVATVSETTPSVAKQIAELVDQARQELLATAREAAAQAARFETPSLIATMQHQIEEAAGQSVHTVTEAAIQRARTELQQQLGEFGSQQKSALGRDLEEIVNQARTQIAAAFQNGEAGLAQSREALSAFRQQVSAVADAAAREMIESIQTEAQETQTGWHARLHADLSAATELWNQRIESALESASQRSSERLVRNSQAAADRVEGEIGSRISALGKAFASATSEAEQKINGLRTAVQSEAVRVQSTLSQVQSAASSVEEQAVKFEALTRNVQQELQRRAATVLEAQSRELDRRTQSMIASWAEQLRPMLESAGQETVAQLIPQIDRELTERLKPATEVYSQLERGVAAVEAALLHQQAAVTQAADHSLNSVRGRLQETLDRMSREFENAGRETSAKWLAEIETKSAETTHSTFEALFKTADWYEKKVHLQMQSSLDKGLEQASAGIREKAADVSRLFASELDHYHRSYTEHAQSQLEDSTREYIERAQLRASELTAESLASLSDQTQSHIQSAMETLRGAAASTLSEVASQSTSHLEEMRTRFASESERQTAELRDSMSSQRTAALAAAGQDFALLTASAIAEIRSESRAQQAQLAQSIVAAAEQAMLEYKKRLETTSSTWLLTTAARLDQQSKDYIRSIAERAQAQIRQGTAKVFGEIGDALRQDPSQQPDAPNAKGAKAGS